MLLAVDAVAAMRCSHRIACDPLAGGLDRLDGAFGIGHRDDFWRPRLSQVVRMPSRIAGIVRDANIIEPLIGAPPVKAAVALVTAAVC